MPVLQLNSPSLSPIDTLRSGGDTRFAVTLKVLKKIYIFKTKKVKDGKQKLIFYSRSIPLAQKFRASLLLKQFLITGAQTPKFALLLLYIRNFGKAVILIANPLLPSFNTHSGENLMQRRGSWKSILVRSSRSLASFIKIAAPARPNNKIKKSLVQ